MKTNFEYLPASGAYHIHISYILDKNSCSPVSKSEEVMKNEKMCKFQFPILRVRHSPILTKSINLYNKQLFRVRYHKMAILYNINFVKSVWRARSIKHLLTLMLNQRVRFVLKYWINLFLLTYFNNGRFQVIFLSFYFVCWRWVRPFHKIK